MTKGETKCKPRLIGFPMYFYFAKCICFSLCLLNFSIGFCLLLSFFLAIKTKWSAASCDISLQYISAHMLKVPLSCAQMLELHLSFSVIIPQQQISPLQSRHFVDLLILAAHPQQCKDFLMDLSYWALTLFTFKSDYHFCTVTQL